MAKTFLQRNESYYERIIREAEKSPHAENYQKVSTALKKLVEITKGLTLTVVGFRPIEEAIVTDGGINVKEINPSPMESKIVKGLYFAGEIIDVAAYTGGYNLQIAFSTGYTAGKSAAESR